MLLKPRWTETAPGQDNRSGHPLLTELVERPLRQISTIEKSTSIILALFRSGPKRSRPKQIPLAALRLALSARAGSLHVPVWRRSDASGVANKIECKTCRVYLDRADVNINAIEHCRPQPTQDL